ncbi:hypothetical protein [Vannielia litorea]|uniref:hypothetical protein n=1 Tax=Vannielia litorea TaxID=1217970 RepID=UPI001BD0F63A|nr:hypothetical protein [Vannielia litorea]MBS8226156.1 hypothetical protein [Vannielia litorea]
MGERDEFWLGVLLWALENPIIVLALVGLAIATVVLGYILVFYIIPGVLIRSGLRKLEDATAPKDAAGRRVQPTMGARLMGQKDIAPLASRGMARAAEESLGTKVMRPTWGMRLSTVLLAVAGVAAIFLVDMDLDPAAMMVLRPVVAGFALLGLAHVFSFEMRYDRDVIISQSLIQFRREIAWRDLVDISDEGNGVYRLTSAQGKKMRVQKYMTGMTDFLTQAHGAIDGRGAFA